MEPLSKQQEALLTRAQIESGTLHSTTAYAALVDLGGALRESDRESDEESILASVGSTLQSLVKLGLLVKSRPGTYNLTEEGFRVAQNLGGRVSVRRVTKEAS